MTDDSPRYRTLAEALRGPPEAREARAQLLADYEAGATIDALATRERTDGPTIRVRLHRAWEERATP